MIIIITNRLNQKVEVMTSEPTISGDTTTDTE